MLRTQSRNHTLGLPNSWIWKTPMLPWFSSNLSYLCPGNYHRCGEQPLLRRFSDQKLMCLPANGQRPRCQLSRSGVEVDLLEATLRMQPRMERFSTANNVMAVEGKWLHGAFSKEETPKNGWFVNVNDHHINFCPNRYTTFK